LRLTTLAPLLSDERFNLEIEDPTIKVQSAVIDLVAPIGKGQRSLIVTGLVKPILLQNIANSIGRNRPECYRSFC
jgi:transcription termination factor Rho